MRTISISFATALAVCSVAHAQVRHDEKLERAMMAKVAGKIGDIRPGFAGDAPPVLVSSVEAPVVARSMSSAAPWRIVTSDDSFQASSAGSIQTFSDGGTLTPKERRAAATKQVSRVINF